MRETFISRRERLRVVVVVTTPNIMAKHKTTYSWVMIAIVAIGLVISSVNLLVSLLNLETLLTAALFSNPVVNVIFLGLSILNIVIWAVFFFKLYNVTPDLIKWTHIAFGFAIIENMFSLILTFFVVGGLAIFAVVPVMFFLAIVLVFWVTFVIHLQNARKERLMDFS